MFISTEPNNRRNLTHSHSNRKFWKSQEIFLYLLEIHILISQPFDLIKYHINHINFQLLSTNVKRVFESVIYMEYSRVLSKMFANDPIMCKIMGALSHSRVHKSFDTSNSVVQRIQIVHKLLLIVFRRQILLWSLLRNHQRKWQYTVQPIGYSSNSKKIY